MEKKRKEEEEVSPWAVAIGVGVGTAVAAGIGYGLYKLFGGGRQEKEARARATASGGRSLYPVTFESSDEGDGNYLDSGDESENWRFSHSRLFAAGPQFVHSATHIGDIGVNFNEWRIPKKLTDSELTMATRICDAAESELNIKETDWEKATGAVDKVLKLLLKEIKSEAEKYEGLIIEKYVRQGSSREGLKIHAADEFDVLLQYHFDDLVYEVENIKSENGNVLSELAYLRVNSTMGKLSLTHPKLYKKDVFFEKNNEPYLSTINLQEKVFKSIIASASARVETRVNKGQNPETFGFRIKLSTNPPSVNIRIELTDDDGKSVIKHLGSLQSSSPMKALFCELQHTIIDVDIVPGLVLSEDKVPDPTNKRRTMPCPKYAVFKWYTENHKSATGYSNVNLLWRICSSGYEKHVIDVARGKRDQLHIVNALRILKLYFRNRKMTAIDGYKPPPQVVTVLRSYDLKHIAFYCILFLRVLDKVKIPNVETALTYMLEFLGICLEERKLPHFFHTNEHITSMFPGFNCQPRSLMYNLFQSKRGDSLIQALLTYHAMKLQMYDNFTKSAVSENAVNWFRSYVSTGKYYK